MQGLVLTWPYLASTCGLWSSWQILVLCWENQQRWTWQACRQRGLSLTWATVALSNCGLAVGDSNSAEVFFDIRRRYGFIKKQKYVLLCCLRLGGSVSFLLAAAPGIDLGPFQASAWVIGKWCWMDFIFNFHHSLLFAPCHMWFSFFLWMVMSVHAGAFFWRLGPRGMESRLLRSNSQMACEPAIWGRPTAHPCAWKCSCAEAGILGCPDSAEDFGLMWAPDPFVFQH